MHKPILGVLGGVGPMATAYFMEIVIQKTPAEKDQDNIPMIVFNDPQIPDRTAYILDHTQPNPLPEMIKVARWLENAGSDYIAIPCNTAHYFYDSIAASVDIPVVSIMEETTKRAARTVRPGGKIGLMATDGTISSGVFQKYLEDAGLETVVPDAKYQQDVMHIIYDCVKSNKPYNKEEFLAVANHLRDKGCDMVVIGCTELSVVYQDLADELPEWQFDALDALADKCVEYYIEERKHRIELDI